MQFKRIIAVAAAAAAIVAGLALTSTAAVSSAVASVAHPAVDTGNWIQPPWW
jgi:hypothetical protein